MPDFVTAIIVLLGLVILLLIPNIKIVRKNQVMIIERLGRFHRLLDQPGIYFIAPLIDRDIQTVNLEKSHIHKKIKIEQENIETFVEISYDMQIIDPKTFVYASLDANETIHEYVKASLEANMDINTITEETIDYAKSFGFAIEKFNLK